MSDKNRFCFKFIPVYNYRNNSEKQIYVYFVFIKSLYLLNDPHSYVHWPITLKKELNCVPRIFPISAEKSKMKENYFVEYFLSW